MRSLDMHAPVDGHVFKGEALAPAAKLARRLMALQVVEPKRARLKEAEGQLVEANRKLSEKQAALQKVESSVEALKQQLAQAQREQKELNEEVRRGWKVGVGVSVCAGVGEGVAACKREGKEEMCKSILQVCV